LVGVGRLLHVHVDLSDELMHILVVFSVSSTSSFPVGKRRHRLFDNVRRQACDCLVGERLVERGEMVAGLNHLFGEHGEYLWLRVHHLIVSVLFIVIVII